MPADPPSPSGTPEPDQPLKPEVPEDAVEADLWNLDEELPAKPSAVPVPRQMGRKGENEDPAEGKSVQRGKARAYPAEKPKEEPLPPAPRQAEDEFGELDDRLPADGPEEDAVLLVLPEEAPPAAEPGPAPEEPAPPAPEPAPAGEKEPAEDAPRRNRPKADAASPSWHRPSKRDVVGLGIFSFLLLMTAIWVVTRFFTQFHFESGIMKMPDFPAGGQYATLIQAETYWREPVREGPSPDAARREVAMIPVLDLTLDSGKSALGALRVIFRDATGEPLGDSLSRSFTGGNFDATGSSSISFAATDGFLDTGTYNGYRTRKGRPWRVDVMEGPSVDAPASSFKKLVEIPILPQSR